MTSPRSLVCALALALAATSSMSASAQAVHRVNVGQSLQLQITTAAAGDIIVVDPGRYAEDIVIDKPLTIVPSLDLLGQETEFLPAGCNLGNALLECIRIEIDSLVVNNTPSAGRVILKSFLIDRVEGSKSAIELTNNQSSIWLELFHVRTESQEPLEPAGGAVASSMVITNTDDLQLATCFIYGFPSQSNGGTNYPASPAVRWISNGFGSTRYFTAHFSGFYGGTGDTLANPTAGAHGLVFSINTFGSSDVFYFDDVDLGAGDSTTFPIATSYSGTGSLDLFLKDTYVDPTNEPNLPNVDLRNILGTTGNFLADNVYEAGSQRIFGFGKNHAPVASANTAYGLAWSIATVPGAQNALATAPSSSEYFSAGAAVVDLSAQPNGFQGFPGLLTLNTSGTSSGDAEPFTPSSVSNPITLFGQGVFYDINTGEETLGAPSAIIILPAGSL